MSEVNRLSSPLGLHAHARGRRASRSPRPCPAAARRPLRPAAPPNLLSYVYVRIKFAGRRAQADSHVDAEARPAAETAEEEHRPADTRGPTPAHDSPDWRPRRPRLLQVVGAVVHEPRDAAGDDQLGHADHRAARSGAESPHQPARAGLGDPRVHDRLDRARAERRAAVGSVRAQEGLHRGLSRLCRRLAGRGLRRQRHAADPVADPPGHRRLVPVRQRRGDRHRRLPARAARPGDGHQHDGRRHRTRDRAGPRRRPGGDLLALGVLVQRSVCADREPVGRSCPARAVHPRGGQVIRRTRHDHVPDRAHRTRVRHLQGRHLGLELAGRDRWADRGRRAAAGVRVDRASPAGSDARPDHLQEPAVRRCRGRRVHQRPVAVRADVRVRLLLPGRAGRLADSGRHQAGAAGAGDADLLAAGRDLGRPSRLARDGGGRDARQGRWGSR